jgi:RHS repeat-associated protein
VSHKTYDQVGRLSEIRHTAPDKTVLFSETSRYDDRNRRTARLHEDGSTDLFAYDPAGQVTAAAYGQAQSGAAVRAASPTTGAAASAQLETLNFKPNETFSYDPAGNRTQFTDGDTTTYETNAANQYTSISTGAQSMEPQFDPLGNLLHDDQNTYTWDSDIHLLSVSTQSKAPQNQKPETSSFRYDALHRRVSRHESDTKTTTLFVMDGWNVISEYSSTLKSPISNLKSPSLRLTWGEDLSGTLQGAGGIGGLLSTKNSEQGTKNFANFFHYDSNGNVVRLSDKKGKQCAQYAYNAFGLTTLAEGLAAEANRYQFSTKPIESSTGLAYYGFRYFSPEFGRWLSQDPLGILGGLNQYAILNNALINYLDLFGLTAYGPEVPPGIYDRPEGGRPNPRGYGTNYSVIDSGIEQSVGGACCVKWQYLYESRYNGDHGACALGENDYSTGFAGVMAGFGIGVGGAAATAQAEAAAAAGLSTTAAATTASVLGYLGLALAGWEAGTTFDAYYNRCWESVCGEYGTWKRESSYSYAPFYYRPRVRVECNTPNLKCSSP